MTPRRKELALAIAVLRAHNQWLIANDDDGDYDDSRLQQDTLAAIHVLEHEAEPQGEPNSGWLEAAIAWEVCASMHRDFAKGKDPFFTTRQSDFVKHADHARTQNKGYTHPPQQRKPLTDEQIDDLWRGQSPAHLTVARAFARAIERAITGEPT